MHVSDWFPTLMHLVGIDYTEPEGFELDGKSQLAVSACITATKRGGWGMRTGREVRIGEEPAGGKCMHNGDKERGLGDEDRERGEDRGRASWR